MMTSKQRKDPKQMSVKELEEYISKNKSSSSPSKSHLSSKENEVPQKVNTSISNSKQNISELSSCPGLNYNYLGGVETPKREINYDQEPEKIIMQLQRENTELRSDIKNLFYYTDQNKNELQDTIAKISDENYKIKKENFELKNKILLQENIIKNLEADKNELASAKNIIKTKYDNEIIELNCQLNEYKTKLNALNFEYQTLLQNYHTLKEEVLLEQSKQPIRVPKDEEQKQSTIEEVRSLKDYIVKYDNSMNEIKNKLSLLESSKYNNNIHSTPIMNRPMSIVNSSIIDKKKKPVIALSKSKLKSKTPTRKVGKSSKSRIRPNNNLTSSSTSSLVKMNSNTSYSDKTNQSYSTLQYIEDEIVSLERKIADLYVSYQSFLNKLQNLPNNNFKQSQELRQTLKYLENTIQDKNEKLQKLKEKQQKFLIKSYKTYN